MRDEAKTKRQLIDEMAEMRRRIAEREASEIKRMWVKESFLLTLESVPNAVLIVNQKGEIILVNSHTERIFGYSREELLGQGVEVLMPERFRSRHHEYRMAFYFDPQTRMMGKGRDLFAMHKDGSEFPVEIGLNPIQTEEGLIVLSAIVDITERKRAEQGLRETEERLQAIINNTTDAILVYDNRGRVITINKEAKRLFCNYGEKELKNIWDIVPQEEKINFSNKLKSVKGGNRLLDYEMEKILENGGRIFVSIGLTYINQEGGRFIETIRDISERIILRNKIIALEKAQVVGKMAEGIAHHMGTPLASMLLRVQMLKEDMPQGPEYTNFVEKLDSIEKQIFYGQKVIQRLLRFVNKPQSERCSERVSLLLEEAVEMIKPLSKRQGINLELRVDGDLEVLVDANLLELVFLDIITNAVDAMPKNGKLSIVASKSDLEEMVEIVISDTGIGVPKEVLPFIFEPFFTTKPAGKGTGLGLSVAKRIIQDHGGEIGIDSVEGKGTNVWIRLPICKEGKEFAQM